VTFLPLYKLLITFSHNAIYGNDDQREPCKNSFVKQIQLGGDLVYAESVVSELARNDNELGDMILIVIVSGRDFVVSESAFKGEEVVNSSRLSNPKSFMDQGRLSLDVIGL
jgi:hypothetical protein